MLTSKFFLLLGVSGVGKTTIIKYLKKLDDRFVYVKPYTNRPLRDFETDKIFVNDFELRKLINGGKIIMLNQVYGHSYATPKQIIFDSIAEGKFPVLDFPIQRLSEINTLLPEMIYSVYLMPPSIEELALRLGDGRDNNGERFKFAIREIESVKGRTSPMFDTLVINQTGKENEIAKKIYYEYLLKIEKVRHV